MDNKTPAACPICLSAHLSDVFEVVDHESGERFGLSRCRDCDLVWVNNPPDAERLGDYYSAVMGQTMRSRPGALFASLRRVRLRADISPLKGVLEPGASVIDFGTGDGSLAVELVRAGFRVQARDMYPAADWNHPGIEYRTVNVAAPLAADFVIDGGPADAVFMRHVLEHAPDPLGLLREMKSAGVRHVVAVVPNADSFFAKRMGPHWYYWDPPRHLFHFDRSSLEALVQRLGGKLSLFETYGIDEVVTSANRYLRTRALRSGGDPTGRVIQMTHPTGILAGLMSGVTGLVSKGVIRARIDLQ